MNRLAECRHGAVNKDNYGPWRICGIKFAIYLDFEMKRFFFFFEGLAGLTYRKLALITSLVNLGKLIADAIKYSRNA